MSFKEDFKRAKPVDPFDPAALRLDQTFTDGTAVKKLLTAVPVRKPNRQDFIRVHPAENYRAEAVGTIELKDEREFYLVAPEIARELGNEMAVVTIFTVINRQGVVQLWPVRLPGADGKHNIWHRTAAEAAELAMRRWIRLSANMSLGAYEIFEAAANIPDPTWPEQSFTDLLKVAFRNKIIDCPDHPVILRLQGR
jgi:hypothetical protein